MSKKSRKLEIISIKEGEVEELLRNIESSALLPDHKKILIQMIRSYYWLLSTLQEKKIGLNRLRKLLFGSKTESARKILKNLEGKAKETKGKNPSPPNGSDKFASSEQKDSNEESDDAGHGPSGAADYPDAKRVECRHETLKPGDRCPACGRGTLYSLKEPASILRIFGNTPLTPVIFELETLRCSACQAYFRAPLPQEAGEERYTPSAKALICLCKYGWGLPFYRTEKMTSALEAPISASTQWDQVEAVANDGYPIYKEIKKFAAQGEIFYNDDTSVKILSLMKENREQCPDRKGMYTTGIVVERDGLEIALFFSGRKHAGENLDALLETRERALDKPIQMSDALPANLPKANDTLPYNCLSHGRRKFVDVVDAYPQEVEHVITELAKVYQNEALTKKQQMSPQSRLEFHQTLSAPIMDQLHRWLKEQLSEKKVETNGSLGTAISYMLRHWEKLTGFLRIPNAPLTSDKVEQLLKTAVLHRKVALFFKTENGATIGDIHMSLIQTCIRAKVNPFHYLTAIQNYRMEVRAGPNQWLPWNYLRTLERIRPIDSERRIS